MKIKNLSLSFGIHEIFKNIDLNIPENEKIGIVGVNGAGKSTFFKLIMKRLEPDEGKIILKEDYNVDLIPQVLEDEQKDLTIDVFSYLESGRPIRELETYLQNIYEEIANEDNESKQKNLFKKVDKIEQKLNYYRYYEAEEDLLKIIYGMKIDDNLLKSKLSDISGGQKSKITFARLLYANPEIMLLDEPTNHLDDDTKSFVTNYLKEYSGSIYVISHDIDFLNEITTKTLFIDKRTKKMELFDGNYEKFIKLHLEREKTLNRLIEKEREEEKKLKDFIDKYSSSSGKRKRVVQDREKKLEKLQKDKIDVIKEQKHVKISMNIEEKSSAIPIKAKNLYFKYDKNYIIHNLSFEIERGEKFLIVGKNGVGKSTLIKLLLRLYDPTDGYIKVNGIDLREYDTKEYRKYIGTVFQDSNIYAFSIKDNLDIYKDHIDDDISSVVEQVQLTQQLQNHESELTKEFSDNGIVLSVGEIQKLAIARILEGKFGLLLFDEPSSALDPIAEEQVMKLIYSMASTTTTIVIAHRLSSIRDMDRILVVDNGRIIEEGNHNQLMNRKGLYYQMWNTQAEKYK